MPASPKSQSPTLAPKRKKLQLDDTDAEDAARKRQRTRVSFSCGECHRRKQKCDRQFPCSHCLSRKVPHKCIPYTPGKGTDPSDVNMRLSRLEQIVELALPQYAHVAYPCEDGLSVMDRAISASPDGDRPDAVTALLDKSTDNNKWSAESTPAPSGAGPMLHQLSSQNLPGALENGSPTDKLRSLIEECGVSPHKLSELAHELPPENLSDVLVQYYFKFINYTRYPIYEPDFRNSYASIRQQWPRVLATDVRFLPLLFVVLAIAVRLAPERIAGDARERKLTSLRYYWSSRRSMLIAAAVQTDCIELILAQLLSARFLIFERRLTECWSQLGAAVKTAQALDLHHDPAKSKLEPFQSEYRRRIWSYLYHADRTYSLVLGRPYALQDEYSSTLPPSNIDESTFHPTLTTIQHLPLSHPTSSTYLILRHNLGYIMGHVVHHFQQLRAPSRYSEVLALDEEITRFSATLPPHFAAEPDTSLDATQEFIPIHRFIILTEILFVRIALHRPYVLRKLESERYAPSRKACFESAIRDFQIRQEFKATVSRDMIASLGWGYREFQSAMCLGIALAIDPNNADASIMHTILDTFLQDRQGEALRQADATTRREVRIIQLLKDNAVMANGLNAINGKVRMQIDPRLEANHHANLLLGLQQSTSGFSPGLSLSPPSSGLTLASPAPRNPYSALSMANGNGSGPSMPLSQMLNQTRSLPASPSILGSTPRSPALFRPRDRDRGTSNSTGSPIDDESETQRLFDRFCNTLGGDATGQFWDPVLTQWPLGGQDTVDTFGSFIPQPFVEHAPSPEVAPDGVFWETLVNQIREGGGVRVNDN